MTQAPLHLDLPQPADGPVTRPFWEGVQQGRLMVQHCHSCSNYFLPGREECPRCLSADLVWKEASGKGRLVSWVVYYRAFSPVFASRLPYAVAVVELDEGARLISNIVGVDDLEGLKIDQRLVVRIEKDGDLFVPRFSPEF